MKSACALTPSFMLPDGSWVGSVRAWQHAAIPGVDWVDEHEVVKPIQLSGLSCNRAGTAGNLPIGSNRSS